MTVCTVLDTIAALCLTVPAPNKVECVVKMVQCEKSNQRQFIGDEVYGCFLELYGKGIK